MKSAAVVDSNCLGNPGSSEWNMPSIVQQKVDQAVGVLSELNIDAWLTFVRETTETGDPILPIILGQPLTWSSSRCSWTVARRTRYSRNRRGRCDGIARATAPAIAISRIRSAPSRWASSM